MNINDYNNDIYINGRRYEFKDCINCGSHNHYFGIDENYMDYFYNYIYYGDAHYMGIMSYEFD